MANKAVRTNRLTLLITALLTLLITIATAGAVHLYPFGNYTTLYTDGDQYLGFFSYFIDLLRTDNNLLYSWESVLSGNMLPSAAYYCFSPFNILLFLFRDVLLGIFIVTIVKIMMAAMSFCTLLNERCTDLLPALRIALSVSYGLSGYMVFYFWNSTWMDGVIALPLVALGLYRLVEDRFSAIYILSLAYAIISNFYIGFMVCLASVCFYVVGLFFQDKRFVDVVRESGVRYALASLIGGGLGMFIVIPAYLGMPTDRQISLAEAMRGLVLNLRPVDMISGLLTARMEEQSANYPILYSGGMVVLTLFLLYLFDDRIRERKRAALTGLLILFFISFYFNMTNYFWHGGTQNAWFNYRYSFVLIFVVLYTAAHALHELRGMSPKAFKRAILVNVVLIIWVLTETQWSFDAKGIFVDVLSLIAGILLCRYLVRGVADPFDGSKHREKGRVVFSGRIWAQMGITILILFGVITNANLVINKDVRYSRTAEEYFDMDERMEGAKEQIHDDSFYRMEKTWNWCGNDPSVFHYYGMTDYASSAHEAFMRQIRPYGLIHAWHYGRYNSDMPLAMQSFFGIKYLLSEDDPLDLPFQIIGETEQEITIQQNPYAMPIMMMGWTSIDRNENPFIAMDLLWKSIISAGSLSGGEESANAVSEPINSNESEEVTGDFYILAEGKRQIGSDEEESRLYMTFTAPLEGRLYLYLPEGGPTVTVSNPDGYHNLDYSEDKQIYCLGQYEFGTEISISVYRDTPGYPVELVAAAWENPGMFEKTMMTARQAGITVEKVSGAHLRAEVGAESRQLTGIDTTTNARTLVSGTAQLRYVYASIPYDTGWKVKVDGKRVKTEPLLDAFLCFPVDAAAHTIDMVYIPPGFVPGLIISILSLATLIVLWYREERVMNTSGDERR